MSQNNFSSDRPRPQTQTSPSPKHHPTSQWPPPPKNSAAVPQHRRPDGADVNAQGGFYGNLLQAASAGGYNKVLLSQGANVNAQGGRYSNSL
ncbi:hypothetical protein V493_02216 [Pseudogymnoascus sp. VKM F-4281 (FW-2241)]|nr:hypothetical protein V493_02216 [Pseudogymnoascus sp. VKM F-4281 (FW-2241)]